jgi:hypothetical protein
VSEETLLVRIGELEFELRRLDKKIHDLEVELRGYSWGQSNASTEADNIRHYDDDSPG